MFEVKDLIPKGDNEELEGNGDVTPETREETNDGEPRSFSQEQLDDIIQKRLKKSNEKHLKELEEATKNSPTRKLVEKYANNSNMTVEQYLEYVSTQTELEKLKEQSEVEGIPAEYLLKLKKAQEKADRLDAMENDKANKSKLELEADAEYKRQVVELEGKHEEINVDVLITDKTFLKFLETTNSKTTLLQAYELFGELIGNDKKVAMDNKMSKQNRSIVAGRASGSAGNKTYGLNESQIELAGNAGMTLKEFSESLAKSVYNQK